MIAIDWGTSSLRGARLDAHGRVLEEKQTPLGILNVPAGEFPAVFQTHFGDWWQQEKLCLMSGMVGSQQGWQVAPYCPCPAGWDDLAAALHWIKPGRLAIVPGLSCNTHHGAHTWSTPPDVMRGEEVQVLGALLTLGLQDATLVLPGTHSKWVTVRDRRIQHFSTYMTGEFYQLLRHHSLLARTLPQTEGDPDSEAFEQGVSRALAGGGLLHNAFGTRTLALFECVPATRLTDYLSGLVIGEEVRQQAATVEGPLWIIGANSLTSRYQQALSLAGLPARVALGQASWQALWHLYKSL